jgi:hypothetical protein
MRVRRPSLAVRQLDDRIAPAAVLHYTDVDGDQVTVRTSVGTDTALAAGAEFDGSHHQLQALFLSGNTFAGSSVTITAKPGQLGGDGLVNVGYIDAAGNNLGAVSVHGDLGRIDAGRGTPTSVAVKSLAVMSMGRFGTTTQDGFASLFSNLHGALGSLTVHGDLDGVSIEVTGPNGKAGPVHISGSLIGGAATGEIRTTGAMGPVVIGGDVVGGGFSLNGTDVPTGVVASGGKLVSLTIDGSVIGADVQGSGQVSLSEDAGPIRVLGSLVAGNKPLSGSIVGSNPGTVASVAISGSLMSHSSGNISGAVDLPQYAVGSVTVGGDMGTCVILEHVGAIAVRGNVDGLLDVGTAASVRVGGSLSAGLRGVRVGSVIVGGSVRGGLVSLDQSIGRLIVRGSLVDSLVTVAGPTVPDGTPCVGIGSLTVFGLVENTQIVAGYDAFAGPENNDVQIGAVTVGGDWIASDLIAGISASGIGGSIFGNADDEKGFGSSTVDQPHNFSRIGPVLIQGQVLGAPGGGISHGIEAEEVTSLSIAGTLVRLKPGRSNDTTAIPLGATGDLEVREF